MNASWCMCSGCITIVDKSGEPQRARRRYCRQHEASATVVERADKESIARLLQAVGDLLGVE